MNDFRKDSSGIIYLSNIENNYLIYINPFNDYDDMMKEIRKYFRMKKRGFKIVSLRFADDKALGDVVEIDYGAKKSRILVIYD